MSGSLRKIVAETTHFRFDGFDEVAGYTVSVVDNIFGAQQMEEGMAESFYHDASACLPLSGCAQYELADTSRAGAPLTWNFCDCDLIFSRDG